MSESIDGSATPWRANVVPLVSGESIEVVELSGDEDFLSTETGLRLESQ